MSKIQNLEDQAARAERLAGSFDDRTNKQLRAYAAECREQLEQLADERKAI